MDKKEVRSVLHITELRKTLAFAELAEVRAKVQHIEKLIRALREQKAEPSNQAYLAAGADLVWNAWRDGRERELWSELGKLKAEEVEMKLRVQKRFGQDAALKKILGLKN